MSWARASWAVAFVLAGIAFALATGANARTSATWDEPVYASAGLSYWKRGDYRINREAPPLPAALGGLAALTLSPDVPFDDPSWTAGDEWKFSDALLRRNAAIAPALVFRARLPIALLGALGAIVAFAWARRLSGESAGLAAAALAAFSPSWLAHAAVLSCDVAVSVFMAATLGFASFLPEREENELGWKPAFQLGSLIFLALASKFTALLLVPLLPLVVLGRAHLERSAGRRAAALPALAKLLLRAAAIALALATVLLYPGELGLAGYLKGLTLVYANLEDPQFFYCGSFSDHGWPTYGLACVLLKSTVGLLGLAGAGVALALRRVRARGELLAPLLLVAVVLGASAFDRAAFGVRRVLPAYPALFVLGGVALAAAVERARESTRGKALLALAVALVVANADSCRRAYPDFLAYIVEIAGGSEHATDYFADSNVDWGQALPDLAREIEARKPVRVKLLYYGPPAAPELYGVHAERIVDWSELARPPEKGVLYAISATRLVQAHGRARAGKLAPEGDWLRRFRPVARAGEAIYLYEPGEPK